MLVFRNSVQDQLTAKEEELAPFASDKLFAYVILRYIEGWVDSSNTLHVHQGKIIASQLQQFLGGRSSESDTNERQTSPRFRVLSFQRIEHNRTKVGFSEAAWKHMKRTWSLHEYTLDAFLNNNGVLATFETRHQQCILMKVAAARSVGFDTLSLTHMRRQNVTNVVYYSLGDEDNIFNNLLADPERCLQPMFFAAVLYRCHQQRIEWFRKAIDRVITSTEGESKFGGPGRLFGREPAVMNVGLLGGGLTTRLSYVQSELAVAGHAARSSLRCGEWLIQLAEMDLNEEKVTSTGRGQAGQERKDVPTERTSDDRRKTLDEIEYARRRTETVISQLQALHERVQSQTTFLLNTATQNQSNYTAAIAFETRRDSAAMKTIAVLTIIFLPGTFVATLFSMDMFQWSSDDGNDKLRVSRMFWMYWTVTIPLTALVMVGWLVWTKKNVGGLQRWEESGFNQAERNKKLD